jgi:hypothetical protein
LYVALCCVGREYFLEERKVSVLVTNLLFVAVVAVLLVWFSPAIKRLWGFVAGPLLLVVGMIFLDFGPVRDAVAYRAEVAAVFWGEYGRRMPDGAFAMFGVFFVFVGLLWCGSLIKGVVERIRK